MEIKSQSGPAAFKNDGFLMFSAIQKHIASTIFLIFMVGCGGIGSREDSGKTETVGKDSYVDSTEHEHGNQPATDEVMVKQWPLQAVLNYGDVDVFHEIRDMYGNFPTDPDERLYAANHYQPPIGFLVPIKTPDGHHVTLSEWQTAKGTLMVHCNGLTSTVEIVLEGMIPNGIYSTWLGYMNKPKKPGDPLSFTEDFVYRFNPPLGDPNGSDNVLIADVDGNIDATVEHPGCILTGAVGLAMPIVYHPNGKAFSKSGMPDNEEIAQLIIFFQ